MSPLLTIKEAAAALRVSESTIYRLMKTGALPTVKVGGSTRIKQEDVESLLVTDHHFSD